MASTAYAKAKQAWLDNTLDMNGGNIKAVFIDGADYTPDFATDEFFDDVPGGAVVGTPTTLASPTIVDGVFDAADTNMVAVSGDQFEHILIFNDTGTPATSRLVCLIDVTATTPNGGDILIQWASSASRIFRITG